MPDAKPLTLALPKGRLFDQVLEHLSARGLYVKVEDRKLVASDEAGRLRIFLVKNSDLPVYVTHGIAGLGICGSDVIYESGHTFIRLMDFPFGGTRMCLASRGNHEREDEAKRLKVATKYPRFTRDYFHAKGIPVEIIKLNGSVELAPVLGLAPYIVDLVETGSTLAANDLKVLEELEAVKVFLIANPAYYKVHYSQIDEFTAFLKETP